MVDFKYNERAHTKYWYEESGDKIAEAVFQTIRYLDNSQGYRTVDNLRNMRLYGNLKILGFSPGNYMRTDSDDARKNRVTMNIVQSMCDTVTNKIAKNKPKVTFLTSGGDWALQQKAKKLDKFIQGQFYSTGIYPIAQQCFLDSTVFDIGAMKIFQNGKKICLERTFPPEIRVDDIEAVNGLPRSLHQTKPLPRAQVFADYPEAKHARFIDDAPSVKEISSGPYAADMINVTESWHLPSSQEAQDGKHSICIEGHTLLDEEWKYDYFPFVFWKWSNRLRGFYGQSLAERLTGKQLEINKILRTIQLSTHLCGIPKILIDSGSGVVDAHINNLIGGIIKYRGNKPEWITPPSVPQDLFNHLRYLVQSAYEEAGVSQLSAQSKKPEGLDSGKALREFNDIESERFILTGQAHEEAFLEATRQIIDRARDLYTAEGEFKTLVKGRKFIETIDWSEVDMENDQYLMQIFPTSFLSQTPSGRLADVMDLVKAGFIPQEDAMRLLDFPDIESYRSLATAASEDIDATIDKMLMSGEFVQPEPYQNLKLGIQRVQSAYLKAKNDNAPEENLENLRQWIDQANEIINPPMPQLPLPAQAGAMPEGAAPQGAGDPNALPGQLPLPMGPMGPGGGPLLAKPEMLPASPLVPQA